MSAASIALDALKLVDPDLQFEDWQDNKGRPIGERLRGYVAALEAELAQEVEPAGYVRESDLRKLDDPRIASVGCGIRKEPCAEFVAIYTTPPAVNAELLEALQELRYVVPNFWDDENSFIVALDDACRKADAAIAKAAAK